MIIQSSCITSDKQVHLSVSFESVKGGVK